MHVALIIDEDRLRRQWEEIAGRMQTEFRAQRYEAGVIEGLREITALLARYFPPTGANPDELPDAPVVL